MIFKPAQRKKAKLRLGLAGPSGSGKTYSALLIASGFPGKIALVDTEHGSAELYEALAKFDVARLEPPYTPDRYIALLQEAEKAGYGTVILDSISHAWDAEGGLLDQKDRFAKKPGVNDYTAWRDITPQHNAFVAAMLRSSCNLIVTMRSKQDYILTENSRGKLVPKKVGMAPVQRPGMDYEFTICFDLTVEHFASTSKDRTSLFDGKPPFIPTQETGAALYDWLESGVDAPVSEANGKDVADIVSWIESASGLELEDHERRLLQTAHDFDTKDQLLVSNALEDRKLELQQLEAENPPN